jgi:hypothetical protein
VVALHGTLSAAGLVEAAFVLVLVDTSEADYAPALAELTRLFEGRFALYESRVHGGKRGFWRTHQAAFSALRALGARHALFLQDDLTFERSFVRDALDRWAAIEDDTKAVLNLFATDDDETHGRWIRYAREEVPGARVFRTQWFDLPAFLAGPAFFERLRYEVYPVPASRWAVDASRSSGVGEQLTRRLLGRANVYQVRETLAYHGELPSLMNQQARIGRPLDNRPRLP